MSQVSLCWFAPRANGSTHKRKTLTHNEQIRRMKLDVGFKSQSVFTINACWKCIKIERNEMKRTKRAEWDRKHTHTIMCAHGKESKNDIETAPTNINTEKIGAVRKKWREIHKVIRSEVITGTRIRSLLFACIHSLSAIEGISIFIKWIEYQSKVIGNLLLNKFSFLFGYFI